MGSEVKAAFDWDRGYASGMLEETFRKGVYLFHITPRGVIERLFKPRTMEIHNLNLDNAAKKQFFDSEDTVYVFYQDLHGNRYNILNQPWKEQELNNLRIARDENLAIVGGMKKKIIDTALQDRMKERILHDVEFTGTLREKSLTAADKGYTEGKDWREKLMKM